MIKATSCYVMMRTLSSKHYSLKHQNDYKTMIFLFHSR